MTASPFLFPTLFPTPETVFSFPTNTRIRHKKTDYQMVAGFFVTSLAVNLHYFAGLPGNLVLNPKANHACESLGLIKVAGLVSRPPLCPG